MHIKRFISGELPLGYIAYRIFGKHKATRWFALFLYNVFFRFLKNKVDSSVESVQLRTYDKFNQCTHPDIIEFDSKILMVVTPYPYSDERYENPCVYYKDSSGLFVEFAKNPIVKFDKRILRHHYSDPAFFVCERRLYLVYRDSVHNAENREDHIYKLELKKNGDYGKKEEIEFHNSHCIAPSFVSIDSNLFVYHVSDFGSESKLYLSKVIDSHVEQTREIQLHGFGIDMQIWHVDVKRFDGIFYGLFTFMEKPGFGKTKLFLFKSHDGISWMFSKEITFGNKSNVKNLYKATSIKNDNSIVFIISALDSHGRWFLFSVKEDSK